MVKQLEEVQQWYSTACKCFYKCEQENSSLQRRVAEDLFPGGRKGGYRHGRDKHTANEIVLIHEYKLAYLVVRKAGCTTVRKLLKHLFGYTMRNSCMKHDRQISDALGRCGTDVLSSEIVQSYFFFTFVRDPIEPFYSGPQQAMRRNRSVRLSMSNETSARSFIESVARRYSTRSSLLDQHLESQSLLERIDPSGRTDGIEVRIEKT